MDKAIAAESATCDGNAAGADNAVNKQATGGDGRRASVLVCSSQYQLACCLLLQCSRSTNCAGVSEILDAIKYKCATVVDDAAGNGSRLAWVPLADHQDP